MAWLEASADFILAYLPAGKQAAEYTFQRQAGGVIAQGGFRETPQELMSAAGTADVRQLQELLEQQERLKANDDLEGIALTLKVHCTTPHHAPPPCMVWILQFLTLPD